MTNIYWYNGSSQMVKWMEQDKTGKWTGSGLQSGQQLSRPDTDIVNSDFLCSGFTGIIQSPVPLYAG